MRDLGSRLEALDHPSGSVLVVSWRRDERLVGNILPGAVTRRVEAGLSRRQWLELGSTFFSASTVSFLMGAVHLWTGIIVQALLTLAAIVGLVTYHRWPRLERQLLRLGLPEQLAGEWAEALPNGFVLVLATVPAELSEEVQEAFLEDESLASPLAVDRRPVL